MDNEPTKKSAKAVNAPKPKRKRKGFINFLLFIGIIAAISLFAWAEMQRRDVITQLEEKNRELEEIQKNTQESGQDVADRVLDRLRSLIDIPENPIPTVATIIDVDRLREASEFYNKAENGDHLIITADRAILYDPDSGLILDVVPVNLNNPNNQQPGESEEGETEEGELVGEDGQPVDAEDTDPADSESTTAPAQGNTN